jgi:hypothetical protein
MIKPMASLLALSLSLASLAAGEPESFSVRLGFKVIDSIPALRRAFAEHNQKVRLKPGVYRVSEACQDNQTVFAVSGTNNQFDLRGATIELDTKILADMRGKAHELCVYRVPGGNNTFEGAVFEDIGDHIPYKSLGEFSVTGDNNIFQDCTFIIRGSAPYGYGDLFGKGSSHDVNLHKHAALSVVGDHTRILGCKFFIHTFGHAIHMHGAQDTWVKDVTLEGALRLSDEILAEKSGPAFDRGFKDHFDQPVAKGKMICLAEDGIRAYRNGERNGKTRLTGDITVINCTVKRMRGGITLALASGKVLVEGCTVTESGYPGAAYSLPGNARVRNSKGDAAFVPLLRLGYSNKRNADIELQVLEAAQYSGNDLLALLNGSGHSVKLVKADGKPLAAPLKIVCGQAYRSDEEDVGNTSAQQLRLINETAQPVILSELSSGCQVRSRGSLTDHGKGNRGF